MAKKESADKADVKTTVTKTEVEKEEKMYPLDEIDPASGPRYETDDFRRDGTTADKGPTPTVNKAMADVIKAQREYERSEAEKAVIQDGDQ